MAATMTRETKKITATARLVDVATAGAMLGGLSRASILRLIERGVLRRVRPGGLRRVLFRVSDVEKLVRG